VGASADKGASGVQAAGVQRLVAFPGAEGFGAAATGGRGGRVIPVTTLAARGPGSLQEALDAEGPRTVIFRVSGRIEGVPILSRGDVTVAGQSSPGGITLRGLLIQGDEVCEGPGAPDCPLPRRWPRNFIVRHLRIRPGHFNDPDGGGDGLRLHHARLGVVDQVSIGNAMDEAVQLSFSSDVSLQRSLFAETLGDHVEFGGMLLNYSDPARGFPMTRISIHHNLWGRIFGRLPEVSRENVPDGTVMDLEVSANVYWDARRPAYVAASNPQTGAPLHHRLNWVANFSVQDPAQPHCFGVLGIEGGPTPGKPSLTASSTAFLAGNRMSRTARTDLELVFNNNDFCVEEKNNELPWSNTGAKRPSWAIAARHDFPSISYPADPRALVAELAAGAGAFPRDPLDRRVVSFVKSGTFDRTPLHVNPAGDTDALPFATAPAAPPDQDSDGMPDAWELTKNLDPKNPSDGNGTGLSTGALGTPGYTNLEVYLHERSLAVLAAP
jgi:hypothetical protein